VLASQGGVSEGEFRSAREAGLSDGELAEVVAAVALNVYTNSFNRAFDVDVDFPRVAAHAGRAG
jgi:alkylhydroperoxidase family enzyme